MTAKTYALEDDALAARAQHGGWVLKLPKPWSLSGNGPMWFFAHVTSENEAIGLLLDAGLVRSAEEARRVLETIATPTGSRPTS